MTAGQYLVIAAYFAVLLVLGVVAARRLQTARQYLTADQSLGYWVAAFSTQATGESAWLLLGLTGMGALVGVSAYWVVVGELLGVGCAWFFMADRFKLLTQRYESLTVIDFLVRRFRCRSQTLRWVAALSLTVFVLIYISAQIDATGSAFEQFLGWSYHAGAVTGFAIVVVYCSIGGFLAVAWTDMFQGIVMLLGLLLLPLVAWTLLGEGESLATQLATIDPSLVDVWGGGGFSLLNLFTVLGMALIGLGFLGSPQIFARFIAIRDRQEILPGRWVAIAFTLLVDSAAVTIGLLGRVLLTDAGTDASAVLGNGAQNVLPLLVNLALPALLVGLYVAAVLAAIMSTVSSLLIMASASMTHDLYGQAMGRLDPNDSHRLARWVTLLFALLALALAMTVSVLSPERTIFWFVIFGWSGIAATFCPVMILALGWSRYTERGALVSMCVGFVSVPLCKFLAPLLPYVGPYFTALESLPPAFAAALLAGWWVSRRWPDQELARDFQTELADAGCENTTLQNVHPRL